MNISKKYCWLVLIIVIVLALILIISSRSDDVRIENDLIEPTLIEPADEPVLDNDNVIEENDLDNEKVG